MSRKMDPDVKMLRAADRAIRATETDKMRRATIEYLWDKYVIHRATEPRAPRKEAARG